MCDSKYPSTPPSTSNLSMTHSFKNAVSTILNIHTHRSPLSRLPTRDSNRGTLLCASDSSEKKTLHSKTQLPFFAGSEAGEAETVHWLLPPVTRSHKLHKPVMRSKIPQKLKKESSSIHCRVWEGGFLKNHRRKGQRTNTLIPRSERKTKRRSRK